MSEALTRLLSTISHAKAPKQYCEDLLSVKSEIAQLKAELEAARKYACRLDAATFLDSGKRAKTWLDRFSYYGHDWEEQTKLAEKYAKELDWNLDWLKDYQIDDRAEAEKGTDND